MKDNQINGLANRGYVAPPLGFGSKKINVDYYCECSPTFMAPSNDFFTVRFVGMFKMEKRCDNCGGWISEQHQENFDKQFGFSGYDEVNDEC